MPSECQFKLNNKTQIYFAGSDFIEGFVTLKTSKVKNIKEIKVCFDGNLRSEFKSSPEVCEPGIEPDQNECTSKYMLIKVEKKVHNAGELTASTYTWPFSFFVSEDCPTSIEAPFGHIRYELSLRIYNENKYTNIFIKPVTVIKHFDLNTMPELPLPIYTSTIPFKCCGVLGNNIIVLLRPNHRAYAPGQSMKGDIQIMNLPQDKEYACEIAFVMSIKYKAVKPENCKKLQELILYHKKTISSVGLDYEFVIPPTPPTIKTKSVSVQYFFRVALKSACCPYFIKTDLYVPIGTLPFQETLTSEQQTGLISPRNGQHIAPGSYKKCTLWSKTFIDKSTDKINRNDDFTPSYPMYDN